MKDRHYRIDFHYLFKYNEMTRETVCSHRLTATEPREAIRAAGDYAAKLNASNKEWGSGPVVCIKIYTATPCGPYDFENSQFPWNNEDRILEWKWDWGSTFHYHANMKWPATFSDEIATFEHDGNPITTIKTWEGWGDGNRVVSESDTSSIGDIVSPKNYPEHRGIVFGISTKDDARAITWFTPDCYLCVHWEDNCLNVIEKGKYDYLLKVSNIPQGATP